MDCTSTGEVDQMPLNMLQYVKLYIKVVYKILLKEIYVKKL